MILPPRIKVRISLQSKFVKLTIVGAALLAGVAAATYAALIRRQEGTVPACVRVAGMDWGGKPEATVRAELESWRKSRLSETLALALPGEAQVRKRWTPKRSDLGSDVDVEATIAEALAAGQDKNVLSRFGELFAGTKSVEISPKWKIDAARLKSYLAKAVIPAIKQKPQDARFVAEADSFKIEPERPGITVDQDAAAAAITGRLSQTTPEPVELPTKLASPHITAADLKGIEGEVSRFQTHYSERGNRARNIIVACSHINGTILKPGERFSYNKTVGPRDSEFGFKTAPVIINGRLKPGMGGGVCQTSTTLYNAVLLADLKIVRRDHHAFPVHYVSPGRDATVAYGDKDFQFENNTKDVVAIASSGAGQKVLMRVFGKKVPGREVLIERTNLSSWGPSTETIRDSSLPAGRTKTIDKGHAGHRVTVWRVVKMNGQLVKRESLSRDYYQTFPRLIAVSTHPVAPRAPDTVPNHQEAVSKSPAAVPGAGVPQPPPGGTIPPPVTTGLPR
jgi:vancomycin resistance protein YoaR